METVSADFEKAEPLEQRPARGILRGKPGSMSLCSRAVSTKEMCRSLDLTIIDFLDRQPCSTLDVGGSNRRTMSTSTCPGLLGCGRFVISTKPCRR